MAMKNKKYYLAVSLALLLVSGCRGAYVNPNYSFDMREKPKLAIAPVLQESEPLASFIDSFFVAIFEDTTRPDLLVHPSYIRNIMENDKAIVGILSVMNGTDFTKEEKKSGASILTKTSMNELSLMRSSFGGADLLLVPKAWSVVSLAGNTFGKCTFRLYDMRTSQMIYEKQNDLNVNRGGMVAARSISAHLIAFVFEHYKQTILSKIR
jgi:hypothetical protein